MWEPRRADMPKLSTNRTFLEAVEIPFANFTIFMAVLSLVWKSSAGLAWLPLGLGEAFQSMFDPRENPDRPTQYPRQPNDEEIWGWIYFCMYGLVGVVGQYNGRLMSLTSNRNLNSQNFGSGFFRQTMLYGMFHIIIGLHHLMWSISGLMNSDSPKTTYGKLEMWKLQLFKSWW